MYEVMFLLREKESNFVLKKIKKVIQNEKKEKIAKSV